MPEPFILYDIPRQLRDGETEADMSWSPNVFKTSAALNVKGIPFKRVWIDFKDVADVISKLGAEPHEQGNLKYTCPVIYDPSTKRTIMDSQKILEYLEKQYPQKPSLFPPHTRALQVAFIDNIMPRVYMNVAPTLTFDLYGLVLEDSKQYFRDARAKDFGIPLEQLVSHGDARVKNLAAFKSLLEDVLKWMAANGENARYVTGEVPSNADLFFGGVLVFIKRIGGKEHDLFKLIGEAGNGQLLKYVEDMERLA
ncbi:hypothetical protein PENSPDRAFT_569798 [Peniophora sp. CONT]|nr:hypothetical protein PENSPDRAFT_569798 [Peniophora sp. CONT]